MVFCRSSTFEDSISTLQSLRSASGTNRPQTQIVFCRKYKLKRIVTSFTGTGSRQNILCSFS